MFVRNSKDFVFYLSGEKGREGEIFKEQLKSTYMKGFEDEAKCGLQGTDRMS